MERNRGALFQAVQVFLEEAAAWSTGGSPPFGSRQTSSETSREAMIRADRSADHGQASSVKLPSTAWPRLWPEFLPVSVAVAA